MCCLAPAIACIHKCQRYTVSVEYVCTSVLLGVIHCLCNSQKGMAKGKRKGTGKRKGKGRATGQVVQVHRRGMLITGVLHPYTCNNTCENNFLLYFGSFSGKDLHLQTST